MICAKVSPDSPEDKRSPGPALATLRVAEREDAEENPDHSKGGNRVQERAGGRPLRSVAGDTACRKTTILKVEHHPRYLGEGTWGNPLLQKSRVPYIYTLARVQAVDTLKKRRVVPCRRRPGVR